MLKTEQRKLTPTPFLRSSRRMKFTGKPMAVLFLTSVRAKTKAPSSAPQALLPERQNLSLTPVRIPKCTACYIVFQFGGGGGLRWWENNYLVQTMAFFITELEKEFPSFSEIRESLTLHILLTSSSPLPVWTYSLSQIRKLRQLNKGSSFTPNLSMV